MDLLPPEVFTGILFELSPKEIFERCRTSTQFKSFCNDESFWRAYWLNKGMDEEYLPMGQTWKGYSFYMASLTNKIKFTIPDVRIIENLIFYYIPSKGIGVKSWCVEVLDEGENYRVEITTTTLLEPNQVQDILNEVSRRDSPYEDFI